MVNRNIIFSIFQIPHSCKGIWIPWWTYIHGIFDEIDFTRELLNSIREEKGLEKLQSNVTSFDEFKQNEYDKLADLLRENLDIQKIYEIMTEHENKIL